MRKAAMSLDELQSSPRPAWLWDGMRARIVWANGPGIAVFGGETLFDIIDLRFDLRNPAISRIYNLAVTQERGTVASEDFALPAASGVYDAQCDCTVHSLPDGRNGILMVAHAPRQQAGSTLMTGVLEAMPIAIMVVDADGQSTFHNAAAQAMLPPGALESLSGLLADEDAAVRLIARVAEAGTLTSVRRLNTLIGERDIRLTARTLDEGDGSEGQHWLVLIMLEDVTERRALERALAAGGPLPLPADESPAHDQGAAPPASIAVTGEAASRDEISPAEDREDLAGIADAISAANREIDADRDRSQISTPEPATTSAETADSTTPAPDNASDLEPETPPAVQPQSRTAPVLPQAIANLLDHSDQAVILHQDGQVFYANPAAHDLLGYGYSEFPQLTVESDLDKQLLEENKPEYRISVIMGSGDRQECDVRTSKFPWPGEVMWQSKLQLVRNTPASRPATQTTFEELEQNSPALPTSTAPVVAPVAAPASPAVQAEPQPEPGETLSVQTRDAEMLAEDAELRAIVDIATDGLVTLNQAGEIINLSAGAEALFGYRLAEVAGKPFADLLAPASAKTLKDYIAALDESGLATVFNDGREITGIVSQGGEISLFMTISRLQTRGRARYCAVLRDITQWKKTEAGLRQAVKDAKAASEQKSEFLARISHELRTPLNAILGFSEVMRSERFGEIDNPRYVAYANDIHDSGTHLLSLINDLLDLSKVEAGKLELTFTSVDLTDVTAECVRLLQNDATSARVVVRQNFAPGLPRVVADQRSMKQIVLNLLSNAIKFTGPGGQIILSGKMTAAGDLVFKVKDTGIGMDEDELQTALKPFARIERKGDPERPGTGLGLPLTRALTEANRARFAITSERDKGTLVEITFPTTRVLAD